MCLIHAVSVSDSIYYPGCNVVLVGEDVSPQVDAAILFTIISNYGINPILYFALQGDFRNTLMELLPCLSGSAGKPGLELEGVELIALVSCVHFSCSTSC